MVQRSILKVLKDFCGTIFSFLEQSANRDTKWFSNPENLIVLLIQETQRGFL